MPTTKPTRKATWIESIPEHWNEAPFFAHTIERKRKNTGMKSDNLLSLSYGRIVRKSMEANDGLVPESYETYQIVEPGELVFRLTDLQNDKRSLRSAISLETGIITSAYLAVSPVGILPEFMSYLMRSYDLQKVFYAMGGGMRQSLKYDDMRHLPLVFPPLEEQSYIAEFLDNETGRIDGLIAQKARFIAVLDDKEKAMISHFVRRGIDPGAPTKDSGVEWRGIVPAHWRRARIKNHFKQVKRQGYDELTVLSVYREFGVIEKASRSDNINKTPEDLSKYQLVEPNDLAINKMKAWQGSMGISPHLGITSPDYVVMTPIGEHNPKYMHHYLRARPMPWVYRLISNGIRTDQWRMEPEKFLELPIFLPPMDEQEAIANRIDLELDRIRDLIEKTESTIALLKEKRAALITAAVTGKVEVKAEA
ncbi:restriction endonuclease subunit S domain-containing protein [Tsuneonella flava]|uniref:restriction endonuclease subunit S n=1 Tax=Tsuneonella flava TaxID=2055955 RepID=UPI0012FFFEAD|nr:restriction endonuclease subunit S [Tsuneonella flava]